MFPHELLASSPLRDSTDSTGSAAFRFPVVHGLLAGGPLLGEGNVPTKGSRTEPGAGRARGFVQDENRVGVVSLGCHPPTTEPLARRVAGERPGLESGLPSVSNQARQDSPDHSVAHPAETLRQGPVEPAEGSDGTNDATALEEFRQGPRARLSPNSASPVPHRDLIGRRPLKGQAGARGARDPE